MMVEGSTLEEVGITTVGVDGAVASTNALRRSEAVGERDAHRAGAGGVAVEIGVAELAEVVDDGNAKRFAHKLVTRFAGVDHTARRVGAIVETADRCCCGAKAILASAETTTAVLKEAEATVGGFEILVDFIVAVVVEAVAGFGHGHGAQAERAGAAAHLDTRAGFSRQRWIGDIAGAHGNVVVDELIAVVVFAIAHLGFRCFRRTPRPTQGGIAGFNASTSTKGILDAATPHTSCKTRCTRARVELWNALLRVA